MTKIKPIGQLIFLGLIILHLLASIAQGQGGPEVLVADATGPVTPIMLSLIERAIVEADTRNAEALIIRLDTPRSGLCESGSGGRRSSSSSLFSRHFPL